MKLSKGLVTQYNLYFLRSRNSAFRLPKNSSHELDEDVMDIWMQDAQYLDNWSRQFRLDTNHESGFVSSESLKSDKYANKAAKNFKIPKRKEMEEVLGALSFKKYPKLIT